MAWYAYCLTEHPTLANGVRARRPYVIEGIQGVGGAPVMSYPSGEFAVIVSEFDRATHKLEEKSVLEHARVVSMSFRTATVLPFRFGTIFATEEEVSCKKVNADGMLLDIANLIDTKHIEKYQNRYNTAAKQLKNCEIVVTGPWPPYHFLPEKLRTVAGNS